MNEPLIIRSLSSAELSELKDAREILENPAFTLRLANLIGTPIEKSIQLLPKGWQDSVGSATQTALMKALQLAVASLGRGKSGGSSNEFLHKVLAGTSVAIGGAFGLAALPVELPISTAIILRSIADIARSEGHDLESMETRLDCLSVFALGAPLKHGHTADSIYWGTRAALSSSVSEAVTYLSRKGVVDGSAPALARLVNSIAARFGVLVSEEVAAKAVPIVGAATGSLINVFFMAHFQDMARAHFTIRRLEGHYGTQAIQLCYEQLPGSERDVLQ